MSCERAHFKLFENTSLTICQLEAVQCIKAVMNSKAGLEHMIESQNFTRKLTTGKMRHVGF